MSVRHVFRKIAHATAAAIGTPYAFIGALSVVLIWGACGPLFHFSDTWQLVINTSTTIVTFLVVFMIQNSQNRDSQAIHLKLDELICAVRSARNQLIDVEDLDDDELARLALEFRRRRDEPDLERDEDLAPRPASAHNDPDAVDAHAPEREAGTRNRRRATGGSRRASKAAASAAVLEASQRSAAAAQDGDSAEPAAVDRQRVAESPSERARPSAPSRTTSAYARRSGTHS